MANDRIWKSLKLLELDDYARGGKDHGSVPGADKALGENGRHLSSISGTQGWGGRVNV